MEREIKIDDESGDKNYFTIIPNYILNHSTAVAQALYLQLKRLAGEKGTAYPASRYLRDKLGISQPTLRKEFKYLLEKGWIKYAGEKEVKTEGGIQKVKSYKIADLWKINAEYYQRGEKIDTPYKQRGEKIDTQGVKKSAQKKIPSSNKIPYIAAEAAPWNLEKEIEKLQTDKKEHIRVIGLYIEAKEYRPENSDQIQSIIKRNVRAAMLLRGYDWKRLVETMANLRKKANFAWKLETVGKFIDDPREIDKLPSNKK